MEPYAIVDISGTRLKLTGNGWAGKIDPHLLTSINQDLTNNLPATAPNPSLWAANRLGEIFGAKVIKTSPSSFDPGVEY